MGNDKDKHTNWMRGSGKGKDKKNKDDKSSKKEKVKSKSKLKKEADLIKRLEACLLLPGNDVCAECTEPNPTMASLLVPPAGVNTSLFTRSTITSASTSGGGSSSKKDKEKKDKKKEKKDKKDKKKEKKIDKKDKKRVMGVFCCKRCSSYHMQLGRQVCETKSLLVIDQWSSETVMAMEMSGNQVVNSIYEANLRAGEKERLHAISNSKEFQQQDGSSSRPASDLDYSSKYGDLDQQDDATRSDFVASKYRDLSFFSAKMYKDYWKARKLSGLTGLSFDEAAVALGTKSAVAGQLMSDEEELDDEDDNSDKDPKHEDNSEGDLDDSSKIRRYGSGAARPTGSISDYLASSPTSAADLGYGGGNPNNVDFTNPACLASLGYGGTKFKQAAPTEDILGYGEATPDSALVVQALALRSVRPRNRGSMDHRPGNRGSMGHGCTNNTGGNPGMPRRPRSTGTLDDCEDLDDEQDQQGSSTGSRANAQFAAARGAPGSRGPPRRTTSLGAPRGNLRRTTSLGAPRRRPPSPTDTDGQDINKINNGEEPTTTTPQPPVRRRPRRTHSVGADSAGPPKPVRRTSMSPRRNSDETRQHTKTLPRTTSSDENTNGQRSRTPPRTISKRHGPKPAAELPSSEDLGYGNDVVERARQRAEIARGGTAHDMDRVGVSSHTTRSSGKTRQRPRRTQSIGHARSCDSLDNDNNNNLSRTSHHTTTDSGKSRRLRRTQSIGYGPSHDSVDANANANNTEELASRSSHTARSSGKPRQRPRRTQSIGHGPSHKEESETNGPATAEWSATEMPLPHLSSPVA